MHRTITWCLVRKCHISGYRSMKSASGGVEDGRGGVALVVGAGPGIGAALVQKFLDKGMTVCAVRRNQDKLQPLLMQIMNNNNNSNNDNDFPGDKLLGYPCDARKEEEVVKLVENIEDRLGPIELAVHNIGANIGYVPLNETSARKYMKLWEMTAFSAFLVGREVAKRMESRGRGTIIFTGATACVRGSAGFSAFSGACMAKRALAQSMSKELGPKGIHVAHVVVDGVVDNPNTRDYFGMEEKFREMSAVDQLLKPEEIAVNYWHLHMQHRSAWTHELDLRPWNERW